MTTNKTNCKGSDQSLGNPYGVEKVAFSPEAFEKIRQTLGTKCPETMGLLFGNAATLTSGIPYVTKMVYRDSDVSTLICCSVDEKRWSPIIEDQWFNYNLDLLGDAHSHPGEDGPYALDACKPSEGDLFTSRNNEMFTSLNHPYLITPIVFSDCGFEFDLFCYLVGPEKDAPAYPVPYCIMTAEEYRQAIAERAAATKPSALQVAARTIAVSAGVCLCTIATLLALDVHPVSPESLSSILEEISQFMYHL